MVTIDTQPNLTGAASTQTHVVQLPQMCPVSGNPQPGSYVAIRYQPIDRYLEVYSLEHYLRNFASGWLRDGVHIRDMEQTIDTIAHDCATAVGVSVRVRARIILDCGRMYRTVEANQ